MDLTIALISIGAALGVGLAIGFVVRNQMGKYQLTSAEQEARRVKLNAEREAETIKKEKMLEVKDQLIQDKRSQEREFKETRNELQKYERRLQQKEDNLENKLTNVEQQVAGFAAREKAIEVREASLHEEEENLKGEVERISGLTAAEAKDIIVHKMENEAKHDAQIIINKIEQEAYNSADRKAKDILVTTLQRVATEVTSEVTVTSVSLPNDEMKGRIIGREGRNIRTLETLTGVDVIIDDTPEAVVISCFDPIRKVIAKKALERLITDGRIHPARIEEVVHKVAKEINQIIFEEGERVLFDLGIHDMVPELVKALGRLHFRTSYGQNVLSHSKEVAILAGMLAAEVGLDRDLARRSALLHDIGKGMESEGDENHAELGAELAQKMNEDERVVNGIAAHHNDVEPKYPESILVQIADAISASRPGARRETLDNYIKRLEGLETIGESFDGVDKCFAIQAGREVRIMVNNDEVDDRRAKELAKDIAKKIESDMKYPGRIKVTIIRETRIVEYAR
jgi:ribonuclease Y